MASYKIIKLKLHQKYQPKIHGLGEIYEQMSVNYLQQELRCKYQSGLLLLSSNKNHQGRGLSLSQLKAHLKKQHFRILEAGYIDSPLWISRPKKLPTNLSSRLQSIAKIVFFLLIRLEFLWRGPKRSHMIYCLAKTSYNKIR